MVEWTLKVNYLFLYLSFCLWRTTMVLKGSGVPLWYSKGVYVGIVWGFVVDILLFFVCLSVVAFVSIFLHSFLSFLLCPFSQFFLSFFLLVLIFSLSFLLSVLSCLCHFLPVLGSCYYMFDNRSTCLLATTVTRVLKQQTLWLCQTLHCRQLIAHYCYQYNCRRFCLFICFTDFDLKPRTWPLDRVQWTQKLRSPPPRPNLPPLGILNHRRIPPGGTFPAKKCVLRVLIPSENCLKKEVQASQKCSSRVT